VTYNLPAAVGEGFTARRDNVAFFATQRLDEEYLTLDKLNKVKQSTIGLSRDFLLKDWPKVLTKEQQKENVPLAQTWTLVQKFLDVEQAMSDCSHEGVRQLLAATDWLPRAVVAPEWTEFGLASFFEVSRGGGPFQVWPTFWPGIGGPNWRYLTEFHLYKEEKKLPNARNALLSLITDRAFIDTYRAMRKAAREKDQAAWEKATEQLEVTRTLSWSLVYYLMRKDTSRFEKYFSELAGLPRDLDLNEKVLQGCFGRAYGLSQPGDASKFDETKLVTMANDWYDYIEKTSLPVPDMLSRAKEALQVRKDAEKKEKSGGGGSGSGVN
jgi:hypothetical protein